MAPPKREEMIGEYQPFGGACGKLGDSPPVLAFGSDYVDSDGKVAQVAKAIEQGRSWTQRLGPSDWAPIEIRDDMSSDEDVR
eukprot:7989254-Pyramimonas_sp.AAC.1